MERYHAAVSVGDLITIKQLAPLYAGTTNTNEETALMTACRMNQKEIVKFLAPLENNKLNSAGLKAI